MGFKDRWRWYTPLNLALRRQADLCEFEASLVYVVSSRKAKATQRNPVSKTNKQTNNWASMSGLWEPHSALTSCVATLLLMSLLPQ